METKHQFTEEGIKALEKMAQVGAKKASESLSKLINQNVGLQTVAVQATPVEKVPETLDGHEDMATAILMEISGDVDGVMMLVYPRQSGVNVADLLAKRALGSTTELDELDKSALKESGNIIAGSFLTAISNYLTINMVESIPDIATDMLKAIIDSALAHFVGKTPGEAIAFEIKFSMGTSSSAAEKVVPEIKTNAHFILLLDYESADKVMKSLKTISGGDKMTQGGGRMRFKI